MLDQHYFVIGKLKFRVTTCDEFIVFLKAFRKDLDEDMKQSKCPYGSDSEWANTSLEMFLEGMEACFIDNSQIKDRLETFENNNSWAALALALVMGRSYE